MPAIVLTLFFVLLLLCCGYALVFGGRDARLAVAMMIIAVLATRAVSVAFEQRWPLMIVDLALFVGLLRLALVSVHYWPMWTAGLHGVSVASHIAVHIGPPISYPIYHGIIGVWSIPVLLSMIIGVILDQRADIYYDGPTTSHRTKT